MFKNLLKKWASDIVLDALLGLATKERNHAHKQLLQWPDSGVLQQEVIQWDTIIIFLEDIKKKGLPV